MWVMQKTGKILLVSSGLYGVGQNTFVVFVSGTTDTSGVSVISVTLPATDEIHDGETDSPAGANMLVLILRGSMKNTVASAVQPL